MEAQQAMEKAVGRVVEALPDALFRVSLDPVRSNEELKQSSASNGASAREDTLVLAYLAGRMRLHRIRVLVGDRVEVLLDRYGGKGRITKRL